MKKIIISLSLVALIVSLLSFSVSAADYGEEEAVSDMFIKGTEGTFNASYDSFQYIKGWKKHYTYDFMVEMFTGQKILHRYVLYTDSDIEPSEPVFSTADGLATFKVQNMTGNGFWKEYTLHNYGLSSEQWTIGGSHSGSSSYDYYFSTFKHNDIVSASTNILDVAGKVLFTATPVVTGTALEKAVKMSLNLEIQKVVRTITILVLCGVGCLALLISLPLLKKVFYHFQIKS